MYLLYDKVGLNGFKSRQASRQGNGDDDDDDDLKNNHRLTDWLAGWMALSCDYLARNLFDKLCLNQ